MAVRTTASVVQELLAHNWDDVTSVTPYIQSASMLVDRLVVLAARLPSPITFTATELELIERWLAAHCYCQTDLLYQSKSTGGASASFQGQTAMHLESTRYGQMAMDLDYSGVLATINKRQVAQMYWLGKPPSSQIDYEDRD